MKKIFVGFIVAAILVLRANFSFANHVPEPDVKITDTEKFIDGEGERLNCGRSDSFFYYDQADNAWGLHRIKGDSRVVTVLVLVKKDGQKFLWVYKNSDVHADEYYTDHKVFLKEYPDPCDILK